MMPAESSGLTDLCRGGVDRDSLAGKSSNPVVKFGKDIQPEESARQ